MNSKLFLEDADPLGSDASLLLSEMRTEAIHRYGDLLDPSAPAPVNEPAVAGSAFLIARVDGHPIGCGALRPMEGKVAEVKRMYVADPFRQRGIGRWLLAELERRAVRFGYKILRLETGNRQPEAISLYESHGFRRIAPYGCHVNDPVSICFEKKLLGIKTRFCVFALVSLLVLAAGCVGAQYLWHVTHHRYYRPNTWLYHGWVHASFDGTVDSPYSFHFRGETQPRWYWAFPTNFSYRELNFDWDSLSSTGTGNIKLPSMAYNSSSSTGTLTPAVLADWLLGPSNRISNDVALRNMNDVFGFVNAAGYGKLPRPGHHGHYFEEPILGRITHFTLGWGVGGLEYIWVGLWTLLVVLIGVPLWRRY